GVRGRRPRRRRRGARRHGQVGRRPRALGSPERHVVPVPELPRPGGEPPPPHGAAQGMTWPAGKAAAVAFTFDFDAEEVWIGEDPENAHRPGVLSQGTYGAKVAVPALLALLERRGVRATFFVPGRVAERHPGRVEAIVNAGHELAHHGYTHTSPS